MRLPDLSQQLGFALPLVLTTSALLLLSSLLLQTLVLHARQRSRQALATAQARDAQQLLSPAVARRHGFILPRFGRQCICLRPTCL